MRKFIPGIAVGVLALVTLAACGSTPKATSSSADTGSLASLVAAAKKEGSVKVYTVLPPAAQQALDDAFTAKYGIKVDAVNLPIDDLETRFASEVKSGTPSADVLINTDPIAMQAEEREGLVVGWSKSGVGPLLPDLPSKYVYSDYGAPLLETFYPGFIYNTTKVKESELPTTWADLTSARWKGQLCSALPNSSVSQAVFFEIIKDKEGANVVRGLGKNFARTYSSPLSMDAGVAAGECALGFDSASFFIAPLKAAGATVAFAPMPTAFYPVALAGVSAMAPHPNAGRLFLEFIYSKEGNTLLNAPGSGSFGPYSSDIPANFEASTPMQFKQGQDDVNLLMSLLGN
jgi:iron(III) transport system substrate-binding protein